MDRVVNRGVQANQGEMMVARALPKPKECGVENGSHMCWLLQMGPKKCADHTCACGSSWDRKNGPDRQHNQFIEDEARDALHAKKPS